MKKFLISGWQIERRLAMGTVSEVFPASDSSSPDKEPVVIKRLLPIWRDEEDLVEAYAREGSLGEVLVHGNMPNIRETGVDDGVPFLVMDYVEGCSIEQLLGYTNSILPIAVSLGIIHEVATALEHLHGLKGKDGKQLVRAHRDVTPRNVLLRRDGSVVLIDFGLVTGAVAGRQTATNVVKGTWRYAAPEQLLGRDIGPTVDIYGLGALLYRMTTGKRPFEHVRELDDMRRVKEASALRPEGLSDDVVDLIEGMTQPLKVNRIQRMSEVVAALEELELSSQKVVSETIGHSVDEVLRLELEKEEGRESFQSAEERDEDVTDPSTTSDITRMEDGGSYATDESLDSWVVWVTILTLLAALLAVSF